MKKLLKDDKLSFMYKNMGCNIARYISISPNMEIRYLNIDRINDTNNCNNNLRELILELIHNANSKAVNIRSFSKEIMKGHKLIYGKKEEDIEEILNIVLDNCKMNRYSIINELIDVNDGGVSGVVIGNIIEFAPNDTPKCVEKPDVCLLERNMGISILETVYGISPNIKFSYNLRLEFSLHPRKEGIRKNHTIIWEYEDFNNYNFDVKIKWPNRFSKFIGDKTFGLLIADYLGFDVPFTTVISRNIPPFSFGKETGSKEKWIRTAPIVKEPGKYYTGDKWTDPFFLMKKEEQKGQEEINIASILSQSSVEAIYSGGAIIAKEKKNDVIEGVRGKGDDFMLGLEGENQLPADLSYKVHGLLDLIREYYSLIGDVSIEWVYDGDKVWIVQMNQLEHLGEGAVIVPGRPSVYKKVYVEEGLETLRKVINIIKDKDIGIELVGNVGLCSHFGDLLRHANIPSYITSEKYESD